MAAELLNTPARATDANGAIYPGARWYFYASGTTTPQNVYSNAALSTSLGAVVTADSSGKFPAIYMDGSKSYRGVLRDATDAVTIYDLDPINSGLEIDQTSIAYYGGKGDGTTDCTAAFTAAVAAGGTIYVPAGTYMTDYVTVSKKVHIILAEGAMIKQRVPANPTVTLDAHWGIFRFVAGSDGSTVEGGTLDGNRAALAPYYKGYTRLGQDNHWWGIRAEFADDITIRNVRFRDFFYEAWYAWNCERFKALDVDIADCGVAFQAQGKNSISSGWVVRATCRNIGNVISGTAYYIFQHGLTIGLLKNSSFQVSMAGFCGSKLGTDGVSTGGGKEPVPIAMNLYSLDGCSLDLSVRDYTTVTGLQSIHQAFNYSSVNGSSARLSAFGFEQALALCSSVENQIDVDFDGDYINVAGFPREGLLLTHGGVSPPNAASLAGEAGSNLISRDNVIRGSIKRFGIGIRDEGEGNDFSGANVFGNVTDGVQLIVAAGTSGSYPVARRRISGGRDLIGTTVFSNGNAGIIYTGGFGDRVIACYVRDNGQTIGSATTPHNISVLADAGEGVGLQICDNDASVTPSVTLTNECSFTPGTATAKPALKTYNSSTALTHTYPFVMRNVNAYSVGQVIRLVGVVSGANADGKVVDIQEDTVTLAFSSALTFTASGSVLDTLTGTGSTSGINLTGVGTAFVTEIDFPAYLQNGSEYRRIVYVNSNTSAVIDSPFTTPLAPGSTLRVVRADVTTGIVNPSAGININGNVTAGPLTLRDNNTANTSNVVNFLSFPGIARGSRYEVDYTLAMTGTGLSNAIVTGLPQFTQVRNVQAFCDTNITGTSGTNTIQVRDNATTLSTPITFSVVTAGTTVRGPCNTNPAFLNALGGGVHFVSSAGNPTGTIRVRVTMDHIS